MSSPSSMACRGDVIESGREYSCGEFGPTEIDCVSAGYTVVFLRDAGFGRVVRRRVVSDISRSERRAALTEAESRNTSAISGSRTATLAPSFNSRR